MDRALAQSALKPDMHTDFLDHFYKIEWKLLSDVQKCRKNMFIIHLKSGLWKLRWLQKSNKCRQHREVQINKKWQKGSPKKGIRISEEPHSPELVYLFPCIRKKSQDHRIRVQILQTITSKSPFR